MKPSPENIFALKITSAPSHNTLPTHLGGHLNRVHVDHGAFLYLKEAFDIKSMLDIGCGPGWMIQFAQQHGVRAIGIDGDFTIKYPTDVKVLVHDFTKGPADMESYFIGLVGPGADYDYSAVSFDLAWSVEFLEHVEEQYIPNFMKAFQRSGRVIVTAAPPGWNGHHHVNCQPQEYWVEKFKEYGFSYDDAISKKVREVSTMTKGFLQRTGMFFTNENLL